jgi:Uma2 family endonuclease
MNASLFDAVLQMPDAALFVRQVQTTLQKETDKRNAFYESVDENKKMEFINGEIVFHSPVMKRHNDATGLLYLLAKAYCSVKAQGGFVGIEKILIALTRNDYEPDMCYFSPEKACDFTPTQMKFPAPDWIVEVLSESTAGTDRSTKFRDYAAHGVKEYWIIDPDSETVEQYRLTTLPEGNGYELFLKSRDGTISSIALNGFSIPVRAIFDERENLQALRNLTSPAAATETLS